MNTFMATICVILDEKLKIHGRKASGYYQNIALNANNDAEVRNLVAEALEGGEIEWNDFKCQPMSLDEIDDAIKSSYKNEHGIWYRSGKIYF